MKHRTIALIIIISLFFIGLLGVVYIYYQLLVPAIHISNNQQTAIIIRKNDKMEDVIAKIDALAIHRNTKMLKTIMRLKKYDKSIRSGYYTFYNKMNNNTLINRLRAGIQTPIMLTFNNIRTLEEFSTVISKQLQFDSTAIINELCNENFVQQYGFNTENILGMFIPNTYEMYYTISVEKFFERMGKEYHRFWNRSRLQKLKKTHLTRQEVGILAAIIDEETNKNDEKSIIAGVYLNRLNKGMFLQADPTLKFAWNDFTIKRVLNKHKKIDSPYNTYRHTGLPPGLIRQPSISAIDAVLNAQKHDYMYFCAKDDFSGYHVFARTLQQHTQNAKKFHAALDKARIYR